MASKQTAAPNSERERENEEDSRRVDCAFAPPPTSCSGADSRKWAIRADRRICSPPHPDETVRWKIYSVVPR